MQLENIFPRMCPMVSAEVAVYEVCIPCEYHKESKSTHKFECVHPKKK